MGIARMVSKMLNKLLVLVFAYFITGCWFIGIPAKGTIEHIMWRFSVSREEVQAVVSAYGVSSESLSMYGPEDFPVNYITMEIERLSNKQGFVTKEDIKRLVKGYRASCEIVPYQTYYIFYDSNLRLKLYSPGRPPRAMVLVYSYKESKTTPGSWVLDYWREVNLLDDPMFDADRLTIERDCLN
jgi:hypothetical protein